MPQLPSFSERMKIREEEEAQRSDMQFSREAEGRTRKRNERS